MSTSALSRLRLPLLALPVGAAVSFVGFGLIGLIGILTALAFHGTPHGHDAAPGFETWGAWTVLVPAIGGLIVGLIARYGSPAIRGHGIPEAMQGIMTAQSRIPLRVAFLKPLSTAIAIGTGGPFGAEGPIIATGSAVGSLFGQWIPSSQAERKVLLACGAAAGMTAVFGTPLAALLLAVELLLFEYRGRSFLPVAIATGVALALRTAFHIEPLPMLPLAAAPEPGLFLMSGALLLGLGCGLFSVILTRTVSFLERAFEKLPLHWMWWPAIGGLGVGLIAWIDPRVLGAGYFNLRALLEGDMPSQALILLFVCKFIAWAIAIGSGTSGGTLAPIMTIGGALAVLLGRALQHAPGFESFPLGFAAMLGMAALFAGSSRAFLASVAFGFEATHSATSFGPLLIACAAAVIVSRLCMRESIMTEVLAKKGVRVPEDYEPDALHTQDVAHVMETAPLTVSADLTVRELADRVTTPGTPWHDARLFPIVDDDHRLLGIIARADLLEAVTHAPDVTVLNAGTERPFTIHPDESVAAAADMMILHGIGRLPVVDRSANLKLLGLMTRHSILEARRRARAVEAR